MGAVAVAGVSLGEGDISPLSPSKATGPAMVVLESVLGGLEEQTTEA